MDIIKKYFRLTSEQGQCFAALKEIYATWNSRINVISRKDLDNLYERHVLYSLGIAKVISFKSSTSILDAGTGGGFPGIPLAILFPDSRFFLIDSIGKKINVVNEVVKELKLKNVRTLQSRAEQLSEKFDFIVSRAVAELSEIYQWTGKNIKKEGFNDLPNGILYLKGGEVEEELIQLELKNKAHKIKHQVFELKNIFSEEFFETKKLIHIYPMPQLKP
jgi:16S rRNA (guanine527-N7)-methyltransferase